MSGAWPAMQPDAIWKREAQTRINALSRDLERLSSNLDNADSSQNTTLRTLGDQILILQDQVVDLVGRRIMLRSMAGSTPTWTTYTEFDMGMPISFTLQEPRNIFIDLLANVSTSLNAGTASGSTHVDILINNIGYGFGECVYNQSGMGGTSTSTQSVIGRTNTRLPAGSYTITAKGWALPSSAAIFVKDATLEVDILGTTDFSNI